MLPKPLRAAVFSVILLPLLAVFFQFAGLPGGGGLQTDFLTAQLPVNICAPGTIASTITVNRTITSNIVTINNRDVNVPNPNDLQTFDIASLIDTAGLAPNEVLPDDFRVTSIAVGQVNASTITFTQSDGTALPISKANGVSNPILPPGGVLARTVTVPPVGFGVFGLPTGIQISVSYDRVFELTAQANIAPSNGSGFIFIEQISNLVSAPNGIAIVSESTTVSSSSNQVKTWLLAPSVTPPVRNSTTNTSNPLDLIYACKDADNDGLCDVEQCTPPPIFDVTIDPVSCPSIDTSFNYTLLGELGAAGSGEYEVISTASVAINAANCQANPNSKQLTFSGVQAGRNLRVTVVNQGNGKSAVSDVIPGQVTLAEPQDSTAPNRHLSFVLVPGPETRPNVAPRILATSAQPRVTVSKLSGPGGFVEYSFFKDNVIGSVFGGPPGITVFALDEGTYRFDIAAPGSPLYSMEALASSLTSSNGVNYSFYPTDPCEIFNTNGDDRIDINDAALISDIFNNRGGVCRLPSCDINDDQVINVDDTLLLTSYLNASEPTFCTPLPAPPAVCGNGVIEGNEACDDGNTASGDGCSSSCAVEPTPPSPTPPTACLDAPVILGFFQPADVLSPSASVKELIRQQVQTGLLELPIYLGGNLTPDGSSLTLAGQEPDLSALMTTIAQVETEENLTPGTIRLRGYLRASVTTADANNQPNGPGLVPLREKAVKDEIVILIQDITSNNRFGIDSTRVDEITLDFEDITASNYDLADLDPADLDQTAHGSVVEVASLISLLPSNRSYRVGVYTIGILNDTWFPSSSFFAVSPRNFLSAGDVSSLFSSGMDILEIAAYEVFPDLNGPGGTADPNTFGPIYDSYFSFIDSQIGILEVLTSGAQDNLRVILPTFTGGNTVTLTEALAGIQQSLTNRTNISRLRSGVFDFGNLDQSEQATLFQNPLVQSCSAAPPLPPPPVPPPTPTGSGTFELTPVNLASGCISPDHQLYFTALVNNGTSLDIVDEIALACAPLLQSGFTYEPLIFSADYLFNLSDGPSGFSNSNDISVNSPNNPTAFDNLDPVQLPFSIEVLTPAQSPPDARLRVTEKTAGVPEVKNSHWKFAQSCGNSSGCSNLFTVSDSFLYTIEYFIPAGGSVALDVSNQDFQNNIITVDFSDQILNTPQPAPVGSGNGTIEVSTALCNQPDDRYYLTLSTLNPSTDNFEVSEEVSDICQSFLDSPPLQILNVPTSDTYLVSLLDETTGHTAFDFVQFDAGIADPIIPLLLNPVQKAVRLAIPTPSNPGVQELEIRLQRLINGNTFEAFWKVVSDGPEDLFFVEPGVYEVEIALNGQFDSGTIDATDPNNPIAIPDFTTFFSGAPPPAPGSTDIEFEAFAFGVPLQASDLLFSASNTTVNCTDSPFDPAKIRCTFGQIGLTDFTIEPNLNNPFLALFDTLTLSVDVGSTQTIPDIALPLFTQRSNFFAQLGAENTLKGLIDFALQAGL